MPDVIAVVPAAGAGMRVGGSVPKTYRDVAGRPVLARTVEAVAAAPSVGGIVVVVAPGDEERARAILPVSPSWLRVVPGGEARFDSVREGLGAVPDETTIVVVHDGARPFVTVRELEETIALAREVGAALTVTQPVETVKRVDGSRVSGTLDRDRIRLAQTPQAFRVPVLREAYRRAMEEGIKTTDEASLVERSGGEVRFVAADRWNVKITVDEDLRRAEWIVGERER